MKPNGSYSLCGIKRKLPQNNNSYPNKKRKIEKNISFSDLSYVSKKLIFKYLQCTDMEVVAVSREWQNLYQITRVSVNIPVLKEHLTIQCEKGLCQKTVRIINKLFNLSGSSPLQHDIHQNLKKFIFEQHLINPNSFASLRNFQTVKKITLSGEDNITQQLNMFKNKRLLRSLKRSNNDNLHLFDNIALKAVASFMNVEKVSIQNFFLTSLNPLANLKELKSLNISHPKEHSENSDYIFSEQHMSIFENLKKLRLDYCNIDSIEELHTCTHLESLSLNQNNIYEISPLLQLSNLHTLSLNDNNIDSLPSFSESLNIRTLSINTNFISNLSSLSKLSNLSHLSLCSNNISDLSPLSKLSKLKSLYLNENEINDISPLSQLLELEIFYSNENTISSLTTLSKLLKLKFLSLNDNNINDLSPLRELTKLEYLFLNNNNISEILPITTLRNLELLYLEKNAISRLPQLAQLSSLTSLYLDDNDLSDISSLSQLAKLEILSILSCNDDLSTLAPLYNLSNLTYLDFGIQDHNNASQTLIDSVEYLRDHPLMRISTVFLS